MLREHRPTIFYGVPTLYSALLASADLPKREELTCAAVRRRARRCRPRSAGAGANTPASIFSTAWARPKCCISFCPTARATCATARPEKPVPGYKIRLVDEDGKPVPKGEIGELQVNGPTSAAYYWNNREKSRNTFLGPWTEAATNIARAMTVISPMADATTTC